MNRPDLHSAFTKINLWRQTQFRRIVYVDADIVAYRAPDELFDLPHAFSAAPDIGWPDLFNTGLMVLTPNMGDYYAMMAMAQRGISFDGADQGLLNMYFKTNFNRLSFTYNVTPSAHYQYVPAFKHFQSSINMVHFIGSEKPWVQGRDRSTGGSPFDQMVGRWWAVYDRHYRKEVRSEPLAEREGLLLIYLFRHPRPDRLSQRDKFLKSPKLSSILSRANFSPRSVMLSLLASPPAMNLAAFTVSNIKQHQPFQMSMGNIPSTSITPISLMPLLSSMLRFMIITINTTITMTTTMNHHIITMNQTTIHITLILNHHHPRSNRPRILLPLPAIPTFPACPLALKKGHILRLEKTRHRVTSNGILNRQRRRSTSPNLQLSPSPI